MGPIKKNVTSAHVIISTSLRVSKAPTSLQMRGPHLFSNFQVLKNP